MIKHEQINGLKAAWECGREQATISELTRVLTAIQWETYEGKPTLCPICRGHVATGHGMSCDIGKALAAKVPKEKPTK